MHTNPETVGAFEMNKILTKHIYPLQDDAKVKDEVVESELEEE